MYKETGFNNTAVRAMDLMKLIVDKYQGYYLHGLLNAKDEKVYELLNETITKYCDIKAGRA